MSGELQEGTVVVKVRCRSRKDEEDNTYVSHFVGLGLIARGETEEESVARCKQLFTKFVENYRSVGQLSKRLNESGMDWYWLEEYPEDEPRPEFTNRGHHNGSAISHFEAVGYRLSEAEDALLPVAA